LGTTLYRKELAFCCQSIQNPTPPDVLWLLWPTKSAQLPIGKCAVDVLWVLCRHGAEL